MADEYSFLLMRVVQGHESLAMAFWVTLSVMLVFFAYEYYIPSLSDVFNPFYRFFRIFFITYSIAAIHNSCHDSALFWRLLARAYVLLLLGAATYFVWQFYGGLWAAAYPLIAGAVVFVVKE
jgi:hypothetical protein